MRISLRAFVSATATIGEGLSLVLNIVSVFTLTGFAMLDEEAAVAGGQIRITGTGAGNIIRRLEI